MSRQALRAWRMPSASSLERAERCPPSHWLPQVFREAGKVTNRGTGVHDFVVRAREVGRDAALAEIPDDAPHRLFCERLKLERLPAGGKLEVAFAYSYKTGEARRLGYNIGRAYREHGLRDDEIPGTADLAGVADGVAIVIDWKTGFKAADPWQLRFLALAMCRAFGLLRARVAFWYLNEQGDIHEDWNEFDAFQLDAIEEDLLRTVRHVGSSHERHEPGITPDVFVGDWCSYCKCKEHCPAQGGLLRQAFAMPLDANVTRETAGQAYALAGHVEKLVSILKDAAKSFAYDGDVPLPDGRVLRALPWKDTELDAKKGSKVLAELHGPEVALAAVEGDLTKASMVRALRIVTLRDPKRKITHLEREALEAMKRAGAVTVTRTMQVRPVKP